MRQFGLKGFHAGSTSVQMAGWFNKEIKSAADVKGLKMRIPGLGGEALRKLGATIVNLPVGEIFGALQSGAIDATEWVGPWQDLAAGFYKVTKYYYWPGMHEPATLNEITVNKAKFDALPKDVQQIFAWGCGDEHGQLTAENDASNAGALEVLIKQHNVQLRKLPDDFVKAYGKAWRRGAEGAARHRAMRSPRRRWTRTTSSSASRWRGPASACRNISTPA